MQSIPWSELADQAKQADEIVPAGGPYNVVVEDVTFTKTKNDKAMIKLRYRIRGGPQDGKALFDQLVYSPENNNAVRFFFGKLRVLGVSKDDLEGASDDSVKQQLLGAQAKATVKHDEWQGEKRAKIEKIEAATAAVAPPVPATAPDAGSALPPPPEGEAF